MSDDDAQLANCTNQPSMSETIDRPATRRAIKSYVEDRPADKAEVISEVATRREMPPSAVRQVFDEMEKHGFIYCVGDGDEAEVKLP